MNSKIKSQPLTVSNISIITSANEAPKNLPVEFSGRDAELKSKLGVQIINSIGRKGERVPGYLDIHFVYWVQLQGNNLNGLRIDRYAQGTAWLGDKERNDKRGPFLGEDAKITPSKQNMDGPRDDDFSTKNTNGIQIIGDPPGSYSLEQAKDFPYKFKGNFLLVATSIHDPNFKKEIWYTLSIGVGADYKIIPQDTYVKVIGQK